MTTDPFRQPDDATLLDPASRRDLIPTWVATRADLNEAEQENIIQGVAWARRRRGGPETLLNEDFSKNLHRRMFGEVWKWAGEYRRNERDTGIAPHRVAAEMAVMFDTVRFWVANKTVPPDDGIAVRLHHRLTQIHGFANGNGRHARMMADLLIEKLGGQAFTWGSGTLLDTGALRHAYVAALQAADNHDFQPLLDFVRS